LDKYIIGQGKAKKAVAIALRNRMRRQKLPDELRDEVAPKNIIMIGPTGVGKTEIARRLSRLCGAPFLKVEATKYTEVGYVGRDVESMIRDLMSVAVSMVKEEFQTEVKEEAERRTEESVLDLLLPGVKKAASASDAQQSESGASTREKFRQMLRDGLLEEKVVEVDVMKKNTPSMQIFSGTNFEEMDVNLGNLSNLFGNKKKRKSVSVRQARELLLSEEMDKLIDMDRVVEEAKKRVEEMGIIFLDEIDKIASKDNRYGVDVSREGVQRDILPIVEGSKVHTRYGMIDTSHILFIAAGAFHMSKPSDLIPELQGRFPLRVELQALTKEDFKKILTQPKNALIKQYTELMKTESVTLNFDTESIDRISEIATEVNSKSENIGARRLHTIMECLIEEVSFNAPEIQGQTINITRSYVNDRLNNIIEDRDLTRFIL
ncbi:MAG TPA: ATP-dependent protease ATPase subunit HslU, partial [Spirochaetia bacterium]|nr:ATP-dependent protease ATPase subunit HslU [Spirochaetia bacterium]